MCLTIVLGGKLFRVSVTYCSVLSVLLFVVLVFECVFDYRVGQKILLGGCEVLHCAFSVVCNSV